MRGDVRCILTVIERCVSALSDMQMSDELAVSTLKTSESIFDGVSSIGHVRSTRILVMPSQSLVDFSSSVVGVSVRVSVREDTGTGSAVR